MRHSIFALCVAVVGISGCGGSPSQPPAVAREAATAPAPAPAVAAAPAQGGAASATERASKRAAALADGYDDGEEFEDPVVLKPLWDRDSRPKFPKATSNDHDCWRTVNLSGEAHADYDALVAKCGGPTGSVMYTAPAQGKLHHVHDQRDTFVVAIQGGLCYRFFGVGDGTIKDLDILIEHANGDLVGDDKTNGPVAIIESDKNWCMDRDGDYKFRVEVDGPGTGSYKFGVWARPKN